jgi:(E)-4-hydroxy-3-methylbut-2-enyl-diphosphate synthase
MNNYVNVVPRQKYCESIHKTVRRKTRTVMVGNVALGSEHPIRIQTMTTTDTKDVAATVEQVLLLSFCLSHSSLSKKVSVFFLR